MLFDLSGTHHAEALHMGESSGHQCFELKGDGLFQVESHYIQMNFTMS